MIHWVVPLKCGGGDGRTDWRLTGFLLPSSQGCFLYRLCFVCTGKELAACKLCVTAVVDVQRWGLQRCSPCKKIQRSRAPPADLDNLFGHGVNVGPGGGVRWKTEHGERNISYSLLLPSSSSQNDSLFWTHLTWICLLWFVLLWFTPFCPCMYVCVSVCFYMFVFYECLL